MEPSSQKPDSKLSFRIERIEERNAVLKNEETGEIRWPLRLLPPNIAVGNSITLKLDSQENNEDAEYVLRRRLLEELIN
jgi:hypothetical protein